MFLMENNDRFIIPEGEHMLSGVCLVDVECGWDDFTTAVMLTIDGINYLAFENPDDGYRSYGCFIKDSKGRVQTNLFPPQKVVVRNTYVREMDDSMYVNEYEMTEILNPDGELIVKVGTDLSDDYYPCAIFRYNPENLPVNKDKKQ